MLIYLIVVLIKISSQSYIEKLVCFVLIEAENGNDKLLLAAKKIRRATGTDFVISLVTDDFCRASKTYVGKLR